MYASAHCFFTLLLTLQSRNTDRCYIETVTEQLYYAAAAAVCLSSLKQIGNVKKWITSADDVSDHVTLLHTSIEFIIFSTVEAQHAYTTSCIDVLPVREFSMLTPCCTKQHGDRVICEVS
jgi:hypothetical protein